MKDLGSDFSNNDITFQPSEGPNDHARNFGKLRVPTFHPSWTVQCIEAQKQSDRLTSTPATTCDNYMLLDDRSRTDLGNEIPSDLTSSDSQDQLESDNKFNASTSQPCHAVDPPAVSTQTQELALPSPPLSTAPPALSKAADEGNPAWRGSKTKAGTERQRLPLACTTCRRRKMRCSGEKPACQQCLTACRSCEYRDRTVKMRASPTTLDPSTLTDNPAISNESELKSI